MIEKSDFSSSFEPLIFQNTEILILGSLPGKKSIELNQYYGHSRNRIWSILSYLKEEETLTNYENKKVFLNSFKIGLWDVASSAIRKGSLDSNIKNERPNDIDLLTKTNPSIKVIGFNGKKSEQMFYKFFKLNPAIKYVPLPSSSPANMALNFENICKKWSQLFL